MYCFISSHLKQITLTGTTNIQVRTQFLCELLTEGDYIRQGSGSSAGSWVVGDCPYPFKRLMADSCQCSTAGLSSFRAARGMQTAWVPSLATSVTSPTPNLCSTPLGCKGVAGSPLPSSWVSGLTAAPPHLAPRGKSSKWKLKEGEGTCRL